MPEAEEDSSVVGVIPPANKKGLATLHSRGNLIMTVEEEETLQEVEGPEVEVEELPIVAINAISFGINHLSAQIMKKLDTKEHI